MSGEYDDLQDIIWAKKRQNEKIKRKKEREREKFEKEYAKEHGYEYIPKNKKRKGCLIS